MRLILTLSGALMYVAACVGAPVSGQDAAGDAPALKQSTATGSAPSFAGDAARGKARSADLYCDACHGANGNSETPEWPSLAGQSAPYLARQMQLLRAGERPSLEMQPIAATLSDEDIADLAAHYAAQTAVTGGAAASEETKIGESLYRNGDAARGIPACGSCHDQTGEGNAATGDPAVRGQQPVYAMRQLEAYAKRTRYASGDAGGPEPENLRIMYEVAQTLTAEEIRSLAAYLRAMP